jgi:hypothetical protein
MRLRNLLFVVAFAAACGGGSSSSPTAPTPTPTPTPTPAPPPPAAPVVLSLTFTPQVANPTADTGEAISVQVASRGQDPGKIFLAMVVHNVDKVFKVRGTLRWNPAVLDYDTWGEGDFLKQGGALVDWTHFTNSPGEFVMFLDRPTTVSAAAGTGEVILIRLKAHAGVTSGTALIQWDEPKLYDSQFRSVTPSRAYGGTVTVQ